jgi:ArsR family transcriptional regulator
MLQIRSLCVCEITEVLQLATSTVSKHLSILKDSDFIIEEKDGKWVNYLINTKPQDPRVSSVLSQLDFWISDEATLSKDRILVNKVDRNVLCAK